MSARSPLVMFSFGAVTLALGVLLGKQWPQGGEGTDVAHTGGEQLTVAASLETKPDVDDEAGENLLSLVKYGMASLAGKPRLSLVQSVTSRADLDKSLIPVVDNLIEYAESSLSPLDGLDLLDAGIQGATERRLSSTSIREVDVLIDVCDRMLQAKTGIVNRLETNLEKKILAITVGDEQTPQSLDGVTTLFASNDYKAWAKILNDQQSQNALFSEEFCGRMSQCFDEFAHIVESDVEACLNSQSDDDLDPVEDGVGPFEAKRRGVLEVLGAIHMDAFLTNTCDEDLQLLQASVTDSVARIYEATQLLQDAQRKSLSLWALSLCYRAETQDQWAGALGRVPETGLPPAVSVLYNQLVSRKLTEITDAGQKVRAVKTLSTSEKVAAENF